MKTSLLVSTVLLLVSCGGGGGGGGGEVVAVPAPVTTTTVETDPPVIMSKVYATAASLPTCAAANEDQLVFVKDQSIFQSCTSGVWVTVDMSAVVPEPEVLSIESNTLCQTSRTQAALVADGLTAAPTGGLLFYYSISTLSNGMVSVEASVSTGQSQSGSSALFSADQGGSITADAPSITSDMVGTANFGYWAFKKDGVSSQPYSFTYNDSELTGQSKRRYLFLSTECTTTTY